jgi:CHAT domain-containing protein/Tfp pilus assembly protein PilF
VALARPEAEKLAETLDQIAGVSEQAKRHEEALELRREEAAIRRALDRNSPNYAITLDNIAFNLQALGRYEESMPVLEEAAVLAPVSDPATRQAAIAISIRTGIAHSTLGRYDEAMSAFDRSLEWLEASEQPDKHNLAVTLDNIASLARSLGRFAQAERIAERQIEVLREHQPGSAFLATSLINMAEARNRLSRYREALPLIEEARAIRIALSGDISADVAETWNMEGQAWEGADEYQRSLAAYDEALTRIRATVGEETIDFAAALNNAAWALRRIGELERSERDFQRSTAIIERLLGPAHRFTGIGYTNLGILAHLRGRNEDAIRLSMRALSTMTRDPRATLDEQRWTYETLANAFRDLGDTRRAILFAKEAVNAQQKLRAANKELSAEQIQDFKDEWRRLYENLAALLIAEGRLSEAQAVLAMEKEEEFVDFIRRDATEDLTETRAALTEREEQAKGSVDDLLSRPMGAALAVTELKEKQARAGLTDAEVATLASLEATLDGAFESFMDDVDAFLERTIAEADDIRIEVDRINLTYTQDIQYELETFEGRAALLSVASLGDTTHLFLTVPETAIHREVPIERAELSRLIFEALNAIESRSPLAEARLKALYDVFIAPVRAEIDETGADTLMLNLQGFLRYVPFAALFDGERYLIEDYALSLFTPAARTAFETAPRRPERSAGFGVTAAHPGFSPLPGVAQEIDAIFDGGTLSGTASLDAAFTRDSFADALRASPAIVHIASHFKLVPGRETDSFLLLGDGSPLNLAEIRKGRAFRFGGVDLLTLSACQTGRGGDSDGGEVESFGALAQRNGASAVMATLWPVADDATAQLMQAFYQHYVHGDMDKAAALRMAQVSMLRGSQAASVADERGAKRVGATAEVTAPSDRVHPYFWSPFILMGNWL